MEIGGLTLPVQLESTPQQLSQSKTFKQGTKLLFSWYGIFSAIKKFVTECQHSGNGSQLLSLTQSSGMAHQARRLAHPSTLMYI